MEYASEEYLARYRDLRRVPKAQLAAEYVRLSGWVGGFAHPSKWQRDELVRGIIECEAAAEAASAIRAADAQREADTAAALADERRSLRLVETRPCAGSCGLLAAPGDRYCDGCRSAIDGGSDIRDWPTGA